MLSTFDAFAVKGKPPPPPPDQRFWSIFCLSFFYLLTALSHLEFLHRTRNSSEQPLYSHPLTMALVLGGILAGVFLPAVGARHVVFALAIGLGLSTTLLNPTCGISLFVSSFIIRPWEHLPPHPLVLLLPRMIALTVFFSWLVHTLRSQNRRIFWSMPCTLLLLFTGWMLVTTAVSGFQYQTFKGYIETFYPLLFTSFIIYNVLTDTEGVDLVSSSLVTSSTAIISGALAYHFLIHGGFSGRLEFLGIWGNANDLGALSALALPFTFFLHTLRARSPIHFGISLIEIALLLFGMWATQSRGAYIALAVAGGGYFFFCSRNVQRKLLMATIIATLTIVFVTSIERSDSDLTGSQDSRFNFLIAGLRMVKDNPIFGMGMNGFGPNYERYTPSFVEWGSRTAHSSWLLAFAEGAFPALLLYGLLYFYGFMAGWKVRRYKPEIFLGLIGYGVSMTFLSHTYILLPYLMIFLSLTAYRALSYALHKNEKPLDPPSRKDTNRAETFTPVAPF